MKTNNVMTSKDRLLFSVTIRQETKTGFLNLSDLQEAYTYARILHGWKDRRVSDILSSVDNAERIYYLLINQGVIKTEISAFINDYEKHPVKTLKSINAYKTTGARQTKTTWCDPYIWALVAMEMNPMLYAKVVMWLSDKLILNRIEAGNFYIGLTKAMSNKWNPNYSSIAKAINHVVFGKHETGILRNTATEQQLHELRELERHLAFSIDTGLINSQKELLDVLRTIWRKKYS